MILLILPVLLIIRLLTQQLNRAAKERERLLRSAIDASDAERRRIARDLHDGVVQELAGTAFSVFALARDEETSEASRPALQSASVALRDSLKALRSLLAEIHPPELHPEGLPSALDDLIAPAAAAGIQASVSIDGEKSASDAEAALVWRVAQEAVRNAIRHSGATTLAVTVRGNGESSLWPLWTTEPASTPTMWWTPIATDSGASAAWSGMSGESSRSSRRPERGRQFGWRWTSRDDRAEAGRGPDPAHPGGHRRRPRHDPRRARAAAQRHRRHPGGRPRRGRRAGPRGRRVRAARRRTDGPPDAERRRRRPRSGGSRRSTSASTCWC